MTREQKIEWLQQAENEQIVNMLRFAIVKMGPDMSIATQIEGREDYELITAEILKRMK